MTLVEMMGFPRPPRGRSAPRDESLGRIPKNCPPGSFLHGIPPYRFESPYPAANNDLQDKKLNTSVAEDKRGALRRRRSPRRDPKRAGGTRRGKHKGRDAVLERTAASGRLKRKNAVRKNGVK